MKAKVKMKKPKAKPRQVKKGTATSLAPAALRPFRLPPQQRHVLSNGFTVHVVPRGPLPLAGARLVFRDGDVNDVPGKLGVADFAARLMRRGAAGKTADALSEEIERLGSTLSAFSEEERVMTSFSTATKNFEATFGLMAQTVLQPDFAEHELELSRRRSLAQLLNDFDDPDALADRAFLRAFWGDHPYGHEMVGGRRDLEAITRDDLVRFQRERIGPKIAHLFVVGDVVPEAVFSLAEKHFGSWQGGPEAPTPVPAWQGLTRAGEVIIVDKPEQTQVQLRIGAKGTKRGHADLYPVTVLNNVLGGGFTSRLVKEIRVKRGLSYGASSTFDNLGVAGSFEIGSFTKTESAAELITVALSEVAKLRAKGATVIEVETAKRYIAGLFPSKLETNDSVASILSDLQTYGLEDEWVDRYRERIASVTTEQVALAAQKYLFSDERLIVLVGNASQLVKQVEPFGRVSVVKPQELE